MADSGYGSEENYAYMADSDIDAYIKYPMFHAETKRRYADNVFLIQNIYYNAAEDYYVCPMGQHMERCGTQHPVSDLGYRSEMAVYRSVNCKGCPFRGMCYKGSSDRRTVKVNHGFKRFRLKSNRKVRVEFGLVALAHNLRKYAVIHTGRTKEQNPALATAEETCVGHLRPHMTGISQKHSAANLTKSLDRSYTHFLKHYLACRSLLLGWWV